MAIILGVDPGSLHTGWGVVDSRSSQCLGYGVIHLPATMSFSDRLAKLMKDLKLIMSQFKPEIMAIEKVFLGKNADSAFKLGHARGVAMALAGNENIHVYEYATRHVKKMLTGTGAATKEQVQFIVKHILQNDVNELDASDALAVALCHGRQAEVDFLLKDGEKFL